jgi:hypothetical protein
MNEKKINARFTPKGDIEANWKKATGFVPLDKEIIIYKPDENYSHSRMKIGDGVTGVNDLPFLTTQPDYEQVNPDYEQNDSQAADYIKNRPFYSITEEKINTTIVPSQRANFVETERFDGAYTCEIVINDAKNFIVIDGKYNLKIDENTYVITPKYYEAFDGEYFGNLSLLNRDYEDTKEPFIGSTYWTEEDGKPILKFYLALKESGYHTVEVTLLDNTLPIVGECELEFIQSKDGDYCEYVDEDLWIPYVQELFEPGSRYNIMFNDEKYENVTLGLVEGGHFFGEPNIFFGGETRKYDFVITTWYNDYYYDGEISIMTSLPEGKYKFSFEKILTPKEEEIIHKLDPKFVDQLYHTELQYPSRETLPLQDYYFMEETDEDDNGNEFTAIYAELNFEGYRHPMIKSGIYKIILDGVETEARMKCFKAYDEKVDEYYYYYYFGNLILNPYMRDWGNYEDIEDSGESFCISEYGEFFLDPTKTTSNIHQVGITYIGENENIVWLDKEEFPTNDQYSEVESAEDFDFMAGDRFKLTIEDETYDLVFKEKDAYGDLVAGNDFLWNSSMPDTGEDYSLHYYDDKGYLRLILRDDKHSTRTVSLEMLPREFVYKIDPKYIDVPYVVNEDREVNFDNNVHSKNIDMLQYTVGESLSGKLYQHFKVDPMKYPYIYIGSDSSRARLEFLSELPTFSSYNRIVFKGNRYSLNIYQYMGATLKEIVNSLLGRSSCYFNSYEETLSFYNYNYINFDDYDIEALSYNWEIFEPGSLVERVDKLSSLITQSGGGSNLPCTVDNYGNVIFEHDVYINKTTSMATVSNNVSTLQMDVGIVKGTVNSMSTQVANINRDVNSLNTEVSTVKNNVNYLNTDTNILKSKTDILRNDVNTLNADVAELKEKASSNDTVATNYIILTDIENGFNYAIQMKGGNLVTKQLPTEVKITSLPDKMTYYRGDYFDPTGMVISAVYSDGNTEAIEDYSILNTETSFNEVGEIEVSIEARALITYNLTLTITVVEFDPEVVLVDFGYTTNGDGTYTITSWNETLNGEPSTEFIVPNNSLIKV